MRVPFSAAGSAAGQQQAPQLQEGPGKALQMIRSIFRAYDLTWTDASQPPEALLTGDG